jgi:hypothetical protein
MPATKPLKDIPRRIRRIKAAPPPDDQNEWAIESPTAREAYLAELAQPEATISSVARKFGVSRQAVSQATTSHDAKRKRQLTLDKIRRPATGARATVVCTTCGVAGHKRNNPILHPENAKP